MRFISILSKAATVSALVVANPANQADIYELGGPQGQLPLGDVPPLTRTRIVTETQTFFEVVETMYMTKPQLVPTWVPVATVTVEEPEPVVENTCDEHMEISCAICRTIHQCTDFAFEEECTPCDTAPACAACQPARLPTANTLPPLINLGITCSLGPGRTVPCELVDKDDAPGPVFKFGEGA